MASDLARNACSSPRSSLRRATAAPLAVGHQAGVGQPPVGDPPPPVELVGGRLPPAGVGVGLDPGQPRAEGLVAVPVDHRPVEGSSSPAGSAILARARAAPSAPTATSRRSSSRSDRAAGQAGGQLAPVPLQLRHPPAGRGQGPVEGGDGPGRRWGRRPPRRSLPGGRRWRRPPRRRRRRRPARARVHQSRGGRPTRRRGGPGRPGPLPASRPASPTTSSAPARRSSIRAPTNLVRAVGQGDGVGPEELGHGVVAPGRHRLAQPLDHVLGQGVPLPQPGQEVDDPWWPPAPPVRPASAWDLTNTRSGELSAS